MEETVSPAKLRLYGLAALGLLTLLFIGAIVAFDSSPGDEQLSNSVAPELSTTTTSAGASPGADVIAAPADQVEPGEVEASNDYETMRNVQEKFSRFSDIPVDDLDIQALTDATDQPYVGSGPLGEFRIFCEYSHFGKDDPIVQPGQPGESHLHMFFGNTKTDAATTEESLLNSGGGTCQGFELNRSAYWTPALLDDANNAVVPDFLIIYYKTRKTDAVISMPQGLQMVAGNATQQTFETKEELFWSCGSSGKSYNKTNQIPDCNGDLINATVQFPNCWDGKDVKSELPQTHLVYVDDTEPCPASHPEVLPQITILAYYPGAESVEGWRLSSDELDSFNSAPGGSLHADWWGGWNQEMIDLWTEGCLTQSKNCSGGQTGTDRQLTRISDLNDYEGENFIPLPSG